MKGATILRARALIGNSGGSGISAAIAGIGSALIARLPGLPRSTFNTVGVRGLAI